MEREGEGVRWDGSSLVVRFEGQREGEKFGASLAMDDESRQAETDRSFLKRGDVEGWKFA